MSSTSCRPRLSPACYCSNTAVILMNIPSTRALDHVPTRLLSTNLHGLTTLTLRSHFILLMELVDPSSRTAFGELWSIALTCSAIDSSLCTAYDFSKISLSVAVFLHLPPSKIDFVLEYLSLTASPLLMPDNNDDDDFLARDAAAVLM